MARNRRRVAGRYLYYLKRGGVSHVIQIVSSDAGSDQMIRHLFQHAFDNGARLEGEWWMGRHTEPLRDSLRRRADPANALTRHLKSS